MTDFLRKLTLFFLLQFTFLFFGYSQMMVKGYVYEEKNQLPIADVFVYDSLRTQYVLTDEDGYFEINVSVLPMTIFFEHVAYQKASTRLSSNAVLKIMLRPNELEGVIVKGISGLQNNKSGRIAINKTIVDALPSLGGEIDYLSALVLFPGVSKGEEVSKGITVRGGSLDQNVGHINGVQTSNTGHLFNSYSIVPAVAVESLTFYKGGMPAKFGNALSSVMDIKLRHPKSKALSFELGATNSKIAIENTFGKQKKAAFLLSGRASYFDFLRKKAYRETLNNYQLRGQNSSGPQYHFGYTFFDIMATLNLDIGKGFSLSAFGLYSYDLNTYIYNRAYFTFLKHELRNGTYGLNLNKKITPNSLINLTFGLNDYSVQRHERNLDFQNESILTEDETLDHIYGVNNWTGRLDFVQNNDLFEFKTGFFSNYKQYQPGDGQLFSISYDPVLRSRDSVLFINRNENFNVLLTGGYLNLEGQLAKRINFSTGLRATAFYTTPNTLFALEPRISAEYQVSPQSLLRFSFDYLTQFDHGLVLSEVGLDNIIDLPSFGRILPGKSLNYALGGITKAMDHQLIISAELFYKYQWNIQQLALDDKANIVSDSLIDLIAQNGRAEAYGLELQITWQNDFMLFNSSYTYARSTRQFDDLNKGLAFFHNYDKPHEWNLSGVFGLGRKSSFSFSFFISNGARYTLPSGLNPSIVGGNEPILIYDGFLNHNQLPLYHRLDIGYDYRFNLNKKWKATLKFNIINVYNRRNINFIDLLGGKGEAYYTEGVSFIPILPSINFKISYGK